MIPLRARAISAAVAALLSIAAPALAASLAGYGFRTGFASSSIHSSWNAHPADGEPIGSGSRSGFAFALFARFPLGRVLSLQPEIGWTSKGDEGYSQIEPTPPQVSNTHVEARIDYVGIPVLLRLEVPTGSFRPYLLAGPEVAFRTHSSQVLSAWIWGDAVYEQVTIEHPEFRDVDGSLIGGGGLTVGSGRLRAVVECRYALGLVSIYPEGQQAQAYNGAWITTLGIEVH